MIIIITGATHSGKTFCAQKLMEKMNIPYISQDHIKMGLIRSGYSTLTPDSPDKVMTDFLWPVTREMIKTAVENKQNMIVEGCYIPFSWRNDFDYSEIMEHESCIENRVDDGYCTIDLLKSENKRFREGCERNGLPLVLIEDNYEHTVERMLT